MDISWEAETIEFESELWQDKNKTSSCTLVCNTANATTDADSGTFSMFGQTAIIGPHKKGPRRPECRTAAQHFLASGISLWHVATATCESSLDVAQYTLACMGGSLRCTANFIWTSWRYLFISWTENLWGPHIFTEHGLNGFKYGPMTRHYYFTFQNLTGKWQEPANTWSPKTPFVIRYGAQWFPQYVSAKASGPATSRSWSRLGLGLKVLVHITAE